MAEHQTKHPDQDKPFNPPGAPPRPFDHDEHLAREVKDALLSQTESAGIDVQVSVSNGTVRLAGVVDVLSHRRAAEEIARRIPGVHHLDNDITVANEETATDHDLLGAVTRKLAHNDRTANIGCRVHKGVITLVGHAGTYDDVEAAARTVEDMAGVREVRMARVKVGEGRDDDDADVSRAAEKLLDQMGFDHRLFQVYSDAGVLFVKGFVPTREAKSQIKTAMHAIRGVSKLEATLIPEEQVAGEIH